MKQSSYSLFFIYIFLFMFLFSCGEKPQNEINNGTGVLEKTIESNVINNLSGENLTSTGNINNSIDETSNISMLDKFNSNILGNMKCAIQSDEDGALLNQTIYISGEKIRIDSVLEKSSVKSENHMISDGEYSYIWGEGGSFKMKNSDSIINKNTDNKIDNNYKGDYTDTKTVLEKLPENKCEKWILDETIFSLPTGIDFFDMNDLQKGLNIDFSNIPK